MSGAGTAQVKHLNREADRPLGITPGFGGTEPVWTPERIAELERLWRDGVPTAEIGRALGVTKSAAMAKAHRLGLPPRENPIAPEHVGAAKKARDGEVAELARIHGNTRHASAGGFNGSLMGGGCRFIMHTDFLERIASGDLAIYCGKKPHEPGAPWCPEHRARVYVKPSEAQASGRLEAADLSRVRQ